jgi:site-specific DNA recombinase
VDRLSRSLFDFARLIDIFERSETAFVSVTQSFNSSQPMGRLTLNILLSFAQFEREIISERTRDKIAASRRKGLWTGGRPLLGYDFDPKAGRLTTNVVEAERVRAAFSLYEATRSLLATARALNARGWTTKAWTSKKGDPQGGRPFDKASTHALLTNVLYLGKVRLKSEVFDGQHEAIIDRAQWDRVQALLRDAGRTGGTHVANKHGALLKGLLRCGPCGRSMTHVFATPRAGAKGRASHRYYRCQSDLKGGKASCPSRSLPAATIETFVVERVRAVGRDPAVLAATLDALRRADEGAVAALDAERAGLERDVAGIGKEIGVAAQAGRSPRAVATLADLQDREACIRNRLGEIAGLRRDLDDRRVARSDLEAALGRFDEVWAELSPAEQARALRLLVRHIDFDAAAGKVAVTFHDGAPAALTQVPTQEAA